MADCEPVVKNSDMPGEMQQEAIEYAKEAMAKFDVEKDIAAFVKKKFDKKHDPTWHCIVGRQYGSYVTHAMEHFIYFCMGEEEVLLFKCCG